MFVHVLLPLLLLRTLFWPPIHPEYMQPAREVLPQSRAEYDAKVAARKAKPGLDLDSLLAGPHEASFEIVDAATGKPIPEFKVHAAFLVGMETDPDGEPDSFSIGPNGENVPNFWTLPQIQGRLESVHAGTSFRYELLAPATYKFLVLAEGYDPLEKIVSIPKEEARGVLELWPLRSVKGRLVERTTGSPVPRMRITLSGVEVVTDDAGAFRFEGVRAGEQALGFPDSAPDLKRVHDSIRQEMRAGSHRPGDPWYAGRVRERVSSATPALPAIPVELNRGGETNLGDVPVDWLPRVKLQITLEDGSPLPRYIFRAERGREGAWHEVGHLMTDEEGRLEFSVFGFAEGDRARISGPGLRSGSRVRMSASRAPAPASEVVVELAPNGVHEATLTIAPGPDDVDIAIQVVDESGGMPLSKYSGFVAFNEPGLSGPSERIEASRFTVDWGSDRHWRPFDCDAEDGIVRIPAFPLPDPVLDAEAFLRGERVAGGIPMNERTAGASVELHCVVMADGFKTQRFALPVTELRAGTRQVLRLGGGATVIGRVIFDPTGRPYTEEDFRSLLAKAPPPRPDGQFPGDAPYPGDPRGGWGPTKVSLMNERMMKLREQGDQDSKPFAHATSDASGAFRIDGLAPGDSWGWRVTAPGVPPIIASEIELKAGVNDLGDIRLFPPGAVVGSITEADGTPIAGAFAALGGGGGDRDFMSAASESDGSYRISLGFLGFDQEQLLWISPPRGRGPFIDGSPGVQVEWAKFFTRAFIDRRKETRINAALPKGNTLRLKIEPPSPEFIDRFLSDTFEGLLEMDDSWKRSGPKPALSGSELLAVAAVQIQGLEPDAHRMTYVGDVWYNEPPPFEGETLNLSIEQVPAGRCALRLIGIFLPHRERVLKDWDWRFVYMRPIGFMEFEMPDEAHDLAFTFPENVLRIRAVLPESDLPGAAPPLIAFLERPGTLSPIGPSHRLMMMQRPDPGGMQAPPLDSTMAPLLSLSLDLSEEAVLQSLPPGPYRIEVFNPYAQVLEDSTEPIEPLFRTEFAIAPDKPETVIELDLTDLEIEIPEMFRRDVGGRR